MQCCHCSLSLPSSLTSSLILCVCVCVCVCARMYSDSVFEIMTIQNKGVNYRRKYVTQVQQQRSESPTVALTRHACKYKVHKLHQRYVLNQRMYGWWSLCTLHLHACQVRVTVGDSGLCCCTCATCFERYN